MTVDQKRFLRMLGPAPLFVAVTVDEAGRAHQEFFSWVAPASTCHHLVVMMREGSRTHELIRRGASKVVLNRLGPGCLAGVAPRRLHVPLPVSSDDPFVLKSAVAYVVCTPEYSFLPSGGFSHHFVVLKALEVAETDEEERLFVEHHNFMIPWQLPFGGDNNA